MEYRRIDPARMDPLWELHKAYKAAIHETIHLTRITDCSGMQ